MCRMLIPVLLGLSLSMSTGFATIIQGTKQAVTFKLLDESALSAGQFAGRVDYDNANSIGTATLPGNATIERAYKPLKVTFRVAGAAGQEQTYAITVPSTGTGWVAGNIGLGGVIGIGVDAFTAASREYPEAFILNQADGRIVLQYPNNKKYYIYDEKTKKFHESDERGVLKEAKSEQKANASS